MNTSTSNVLQRVYFQPITVQSNYARARAVEVAELASRGLITTFVGDGSYARHWRVSPAGRALLEYQHSEVTRP